MKLRTVLAGVVLGSSLIALPASPATPDDIAWAQTCLTRLGFATGPVDGLIGPKSTGASIAYLRSRFGPHFDTVPEKTRQVYFAAECLSVEPTTMALQSR